MKNLGKLNLFMLFVIMAILLVLLSETSFAIKIGFPRPPTSIVTIANSEYGPNTWSNNVIHGTAAPNALAPTRNIRKVEILISYIGFPQTAYYWNGSSWTTTATWLTASGTNNWTYTTNSDFLIHDKTYTVQSKATDDHNEVQTSSGSDTFGFDRNAIDSFALPSLPEYISETSFEVSCYAPHITATIIENPVFDASGISLDIQISEDGINWSDWKTGIAISGDEFVKEIFTGALEGHTYYFRFSSTDSAGNVENWPSDPGDTYTTIDLSPPTSEVTLSNNIYGPNIWQTNTINGTYTDNSAEADKVKVLIRKGSTYWSGGVWEIPMGGPGGMILPWNDATVNPDGTWHLDLSYPDAAFFFDATNYTVMSKAIDKAGNEQITPESDSFIFDSTGINISNINCSVNGTSATITYDTDETCNGKLSYWKDGEVTSEALGPDGTSHEIILSSLDYASTYYYIINTEDAVSNATASGTLTFNTPQELSISVSPASLNYNTTEDSISFSSETINITGSGFGTLEWTISDDADWINTSPASGSNSQAIDVAIDPSNYLPGTYSANIIIDSNAADNPQVIIPVTLVINVAAFVEAEITSGTGRNHPNPFDPTKEDTKIIFYTNQSQVKIRIYSLTGKALYTKTATPVSGDYFEVLWNGKSDFGELVGNGTYIYIVTSNDDEILCRGQLVVWK